MSPPPTLLGLYRPGRTVLHRAPTGAKLLGLAVAAVAVVVVRGPWSALVALVAGVALTALARVGVPRTVRSLRPLLVVAVAIGLLQWWRLGWPVAVEVVGDLLSLALAATALTATTSTDSLLDAVVRASRPLRPLGVSPEHLAFAFALTLRAAPQVLEMAAETRQAARARGLERDPRALLVPLAVRTVARARATGEALAARGLPPGD